MKRRDVLLTLLALGAAPFPVVAQQQERVWRVGFISFRSRPASLDADFYGGFPKGMNELGYAEGKNLTIEWRFADGNPETLAAMAAELAQLKVDVVVAAGDVATAAVKKAAPAIPIVMGASADPIGNRLVASLARPGGNITGLSNISRELLPKQLELLLGGIVQKGGTVAVLTDPQSLGHAAFLESAKSAAQRMDVAVLSVEAHTLPEIAAAFTTMKREAAAAVIITLAPQFVQQARAIADIAAMNGLPSISPNREYAESGGLMSYGQNQAESYRRAATFVDKIFKGANAGDLPVEQPTKFEFVVNLKTAKALGLEIPSLMMLRADQVIE